MDNTLTQERINEAILAVTGGPDWQIVVKALQNDIYNAQASALEAKSWEQVCETRGFATGLAYIIGIRDTTKRAMEIENDADV